MVRKVRHSLTRLKLVAVQWTASAFPCEYREMTRADRLLLLAFALANAILYSSLLPLWEGFDEPWHYGYVQSLSSTFRFPVLGKTRLSQEVWASMLACPASHVVAHAWPQLQTFDRYFALSPDARAQERSCLEAIPRGDASLDSEHTNYEAQQPPLAYIVLAGPNLLLANASITTRVLWLRIFAAGVSLLITFFAASNLFRALDLPPAYQALGLYCIFACQMYWATIAHVGNDTLGLALSVWFFAACATFSKQPTPATAMRLALVTSLGLLTKAYFLPLLAFAGCVAVYRRVRMLPAFAAMVLLIAGPWYVRNLMLYHNLSGLLMASAGTPGQTLSSLTSIDWSHAIPYMLRATLWTGNNSFTNFSSVTLNCLLALLATGTALYAVRAFQRAPSDAEWAVLGALAFYAAAVIYVVGNDVIFLRGASAGAAPWYTEVLLAPILAISLLGLSQSRRIGRPVAVAMLLLWTYIWAATYLVKLIPLYGGYTKGRTTLKETLEWYLTSHHELTNMLSTISLAPPVTIYVETCATIGLVVVIARRLVHLLSTEIHDSGKR